MSTATMSCAQLWGSWGSPPLPFSAKEQKCPFCSALSTSNRAHFLEKSLISRKKPDFKSCQGSSPVPPFSSPAVIKQSIKIIGFPSSDISKPHTVFSLFITLKNNIYRPYLLLKSVDMAFSWIGPLPSKIPICCLKLMNDILLLSICVEYQGQYLAAQIIHVTRHFAQ